MSLWKILKIICNGFVAGHSFIDLVSEWRQKISVKAKSIIEDPANLKIVSIATIWEIAIKLSLDKIRLPKGLKHFLDMIEENGFEVLPITFEHAVELSTLEFIHRDPFDRLLIAQCIADKLTIVTQDEYIKQYNIQAIW